MYIPWEATQHRAYPGRTEFVGGNIFFIVYGTMPGVRYPNHDNESAGPAPGTRPNNNSLISSNEGIRMIHPNSIHAYGDMRARLNERTWRYVVLEPSNTVGLPNDSGHGYAIGGLSSSHRARTPINVGGVPRYPNEPTTIRVTPSEFFTIANLPLMAMRWERQGYSITSGGFLGIGTTTTVIHALTYDFVYAMPWHNATVWYANAESLDPWGNVLPGGLFDINTHSMADGQPIIGTRFTICVPFSLPVNGLTHHFRYAIRIQIATT
jgi:hypothetical protein